MRPQSAVIATMVMLGTTITVPTFFLPKTASAQVIPVVSTPAGPVSDLRRIANPQFTYTVRKDDTLSSIAARKLGSPAWWPQLWWRNHKPDPASLRVGMVLHYGRAWRRRPRVPAALQQQLSTTSTPTSVGSSGGTSSTTPVSVGSSGGGAGGAFGACVRMAEEGGSYVWGPGNGGGAYQFLYSTWVAYGGAPGDYGSAGPAEQDQVFLNALARGGQGNWSQYDGCSAGLSTDAVSAVRFASFHRHRRFVPLRLIAWRHALTHRWRWYEWGGTGPAGFDCSGLVYRSYIEAGRILGRSTYDMLADPHVHFTSHPRKGMLAFFGSGHVELYVRPGVTYGAQKSGTQVNYHPYNGFWHPTMFAWVSRH